MSQAEKDKRCGKVADFSLCPFTLAILYKKRREMCDQVSWSEILTSLAPPPPALNSIWANRRGGGGSKYCTHTGYKMQTRLLYHSFWQLRSAWIRVFKRKGCWRQDWSKKEPCIIKPSWVGCARWLLGLNLSRPKWRETLALTGPPGLTWTKS